MTDSDAPIPLARTAALRTRGMTVRCLQPTSSSHSALVSELLQAYVREANKHNQGENMKVCVPETVPRHAILLTPLPTVHVEERSRGTSVEAEPKDILRRGRRRCHGTMSMTSYRDRSGRNGCSSLTCRIQCLQKVSTSDSMHANESYIKKHRAV